MRFVIEIDDVEEIKNNVQSIEMTACNVAISDVEVIYRYDYTKYVWNAKGHGVNSYDLSGREIAIHNIGNFSNDRATAMDFYQWLAF